MRKIEFEIDLNNASDEELIAYATLLKAKKKPGNKEINLPIGSIEEEIEQKVQHTPEIQRYDFKPRMPVKVRASKIIAYCKQHDWISTDDLGKFSIPQGGTMNKIRKILFKHQKLIKKQFERVIYFIYNDENAREKLEKLQKAKNDLGVSIEKFQFERKRIKQKKKNIDKSGFNLFRSVKLKQYLLQKMTHQEAFKKVNEEWALLKKRKALSPGVLKDFPEITGLNHKYQKILIDMLTRIAEIGGSLNFHPTAGIFELNTAGKWDDFISDIFLKSDAICELLHIVNNFGIEGEGKNKQLRYQK